MDITLPIRTISESNHREHWAQRARRAQQQRSEVYLTLRAAWGAPPQAPYSMYGPILVLLTRLAPRAFDQGNLEASLKHIQDGVADWLAGAYGQGQDRQEGLLWRYRQQRGAPKTYAVVIWVEALTTRAAAILEGSDPDATST